MLQGEGMRSFEGWNAVCQWNFGKWTLLAESCLPMALNLSALLELMIIPGSVSQPD
jgi:hypothetical protein